MSLLFYMSIDTVLLHRTHVYACEKTQNFHFVIQMCVLKPSTSLHKTLHTNFHTQRESVSLT